MHDVGFELFFTFFSPKIYGRRKYRVIFYKKKNIGFCFEKKYHFSKCSIRNLRLNFVNETLKINQTQHLRFNSKHAINAYDITNVPQTKKF